MLGFRERTPASQLKKWSKNLMINADVLTTQCKDAAQKDPTAKEERRMVREIKTRQKREAKLKKA